MKRDEEYLGDGLYVSFDGWQFCLRAPRDYKDDRVYLDQHIYKNFVEFVRRTLEEDASAKA